MADVFCRHELKYLLTQEQYILFMNDIKDKITSDKYPFSTISNIYYDTDSFYLIRKSLEHPSYKEKLRMRSYGIKNKDEVFLEIKKKYDSIVYKRREKFKSSDALSFIDNPKPFSQISNEIAYFINNYTIQPAVYLYYERNSYVGLNDLDLRITFDNNIRYRDYDLDLSKGNYGKEILEKNQILMEIKCANSMPMWLATALSKNKIYKTSFSKYGNAYLDICKNSSEVNYARVI